MTFPLGIAQPDRYQSLLLQKVKNTQEQFESIFDREQLEVYPSPPSHFRMRAEFRIWHENDEAHFAMYEPDAYKKPKIIDSFTIGSTAICDLMPKLILAINDSEILKHRLFQVEFLTTLSGESLITLIYHKPLEDDWLLAAENLQNALDCHIIGRSRKQKCVLTQDFVSEHLSLTNGKYQYQQIETGFTQPNAHVCIDMLNWCIENTAHVGGDLLELYCGNGNFTLPLSFNFRKVMATEISKLSTRAAQKNIEDNGITNISLVRLSAEEVCEALKGTREFRRLKDININEFAFSTVFVDPPRAGLDEQTCDFISQFRNIIYISCNPTTLKRDLEVLDATHVIKKFALFDQFPYSDHRECGVILTHCDQ